MKLKYLFLIVSLNIILVSCSHKEIPSDMNIIFLHHSTGDILWNGRQPSLLNKAFRKISPKLAKKINKNGLIPTMVKEHNKAFNTNYNIQEMIFPKSSPYGWNNFPYDYYNIWVKNAGVEPYMEEPTLELLTKKYQVVIFKHCFPVCYINDEVDIADVDSDVKTMANYKLQYAALKDKLHKFTDTKFILFTGAAQVEGNISEDAARLAQDFFNWVRNEWDLPGDNIYLWDLYGLQTEGGLYFKDEYASSPTDSHPNNAFAEKAGKLLFNRIIDVIENEGTKTASNGKKQ
ncbi:hypothetical protein [Saccharicrinis sp. GN24d3]|uniref:hypothetical protein n=1 Tax=Saccharicrinis sp. GN24d3 TaxID=3458416 RepID=UPI0040351FFB